MVVGGGGGQGASFAGVEGATERMGRLRSRRWEGGQVRLTPRAICSVSHALLGILLIFFSPFPTTDCILCLRPGTFLNLESSPTVPLCSSLFVYIWYYMMEKKIFKARKIATTRSLMTLGECFPWCVGADVRLQ